MSNYDDAFKSPLQNKIKKKKESKTENQFKRNRFQFKNACCFPKIKLFRKYLLYICERLLQNRLNFLQIIYDFVN